MKSKRLKWVLPVITVLFAVLATPVQFVAQEQTKLHHHYKLIDITTFGGPSSYFDDLHLTDNFFFNNVFYNFSQVLNSKKVLVGFADTPTLDPYSANPVFCYVLDCFVTHAYRWHNGLKTDLGALAGSASSAAFWINSNGLIAGNSQNGELDPVIPGLPELRAVIWKYGKIRDLGTLGGSSSFSQAVNDRGQVTGLALNSIPDPFSFYYQYLYCLPFQICPANATETRAFVWDEENGMQDIGTLGGPDAFPSLINNHGQIAGFSYTDSIPQPTTGFPTLHPFLWEKGKGMKDLGSLGGTNTASVNGLNERGEVVGGAFLAGDLTNAPFLWDGEKLINLVAPPFEGGGEANWINESGEVVGIAGIPTPCFQPAGHAFLWRKGVMTDLGALPGSPVSQANFINSRSQIVGDSFPCDFSSRTGFLWEDGSLVDLNALVPPNTPFYLFTASFISDQGEIAAFGSLPNGDTHAVLLVPCDDNHPGIDGCDYDPVDPNVVSTDTSRPATRNANALISGELRARFLRQPSLAKFLRNPRQAVLSSPAAALSPIATLSPTSLTFSVQALSTTSPAKIVTMKNTGTANLTIASIAITGTNAGDFAQTHTCAGSLAAGSSCSISVTFKPTASGTRAAALSVTDNASVSPQQVPLNGTGTTAKLLPTSLNFGTVAIGTTSRSESVTLTNVGTTTLTITGITLTGTNAADFLQTHTCGSSLAAGASCSISVTFNPTASGMRTAALSVSDNAAGSSQKVSLSGTGTTAKLIPSGLVYFGSVQIGTTSAARTVTLTNVGTTTLTITGITLTGTNAADFLQTHTCGSSLAAGASCSISVTFKPTQSGLRTATLSVADNASGSPQTVPLAGGCIPQGGICYGPSGNMCCPAPRFHHSFCSNPNGYGTCIEQ